MIPLALEEIITAIEGKLLLPEQSSAALRSRVTGVTIDSRKIKPGDLFFAIRGENHDGHTFVRDVLAQGAAAAVVARGYQPSHDLDESAMLITVSDTIQALGRLGRYHRKLSPADIVAVTGSNGKTTTRDMIAYLLGHRRKGRAAIKSFNNEIGVPLTLLSAEVGDEFLVVEVGTNAPGEIDRLARLIEPDVAVITSVGPAHLERLGSLDGIAAEKLSLLRHLRPGGCAIVNIDQEFVRFRLNTMQRPKTALAPNDGGLPKDVKLITFGRHESADLRLTAVSSNTSGASPSLEFKVNDKIQYKLGIPGEHNASNALAAIAVGRRFGMTDAEIAERLSPAGGFNLPPMRMEHRKGGADGSIEIIVDAYNANPASVKAAIDVLCHHPCPTSGRRVIILGDMKELGNQSGEMHDQVARDVAASNIDVMLTIGDHAEHMAQTAKQAKKNGGGKFTVKAMPNTDTAVRGIRKMCRSGDVILIKGSRVMGLERVADALSRHGN